jgi:hypothetical protein
MKAVAALTTGNTTAFTNALSPMIGTSASGALGQVMTALPTTLLADAAKKAVSMLGGGGSTSGSSGALGNLPQNWHAIASYLAAHGFSKFAAAGVAGNIEAESGGNPEAIEVGGGGGGGLIQWTPWQSYGNLITGNASTDLMNQLAQVLVFGGGPARVNKGTSPSNAALIYQDYYERPASDTASLGTRMAAANAVAKGMGWSYDSGGALPPGMRLTVNNTGQPEAVLNPQQLEWLQQAAERDTAAQQHAPAINLNYYGPQEPSPEQKAIIYRELSLLMA